MKRDFFLVLQLIVSTLLVIFILLQPKGKGLSSSITERSFSFTRRGLDRFIFRATFFLAFLFVVISVIVFAL